MKTLIITGLLAVFTIANGQTLENKNTRIEFNPSTGTFNLTVGNILAISNAHVTVQGWSSSDTGRQSKITHRNRDRFRVECSRPGAPTLLLEFNLRPAFVELRAGLKNTTANPIRIKKMHPLAGGVVFPGAEWSEVRTLDGPTGANQPCVTAGAVRGSANNLLVTFTQSGERRSLVLGALKTTDFTKWMHIQTGHIADMEAYDPVGRLVNPGETYLPEDSFYVDASTANPFEALEKYGCALRDATGAKPSPYDFPTVCAWYAGVWKTPGAQDHPDKSAYKINTSAGMVEESQKINASGFLNCSRAAVRLVPDSYTKENPQGWWDDEHWQKHGYYTAPYETSAKLGRAMHDNGCLAFTYIQPQIQFPKLGNRISRDFRESHRDWLLNKDIDRNLDYSLPAVQEHVRSRFAALRGHIDGLMVDYCDELWLSALYGHSPEARLGASPWEDVNQDTSGEVIRLTDPKMTATGVYRSFFKVLRAGLGSNARIHERCLNQPNNDLTFGITDSQRTACDTDKISPDLVSRSGLRWFKNRVVISYDMDSKDLTSAWKVEGWSGTDQDGRRMMLTMAYVAASRLLLANSFRDLAPETLHDLERTFPYPTESRSARPIDAFVHDGWPRVYDFAVTPDWHQVTFFNSALPTREETISVPLAGDTAGGALGLDSAAEYYAYDFWNDRFVGRFKGGYTLAQTLRPGEARMLSIRKVENHPQVLSTSRHIMQGLAELSDVKWDAAKKHLTGKADLIAGEPMRIALVGNGFKATNASSGNASARLEPHTAAAEIAVLLLESPRNGQVWWSVEYQAPKP